MIPLKFQNTMLRIIFITAYLDIPQKKLQLNIKPMTE